MQKKQTEEDAQAEKERLMELFLNYSRKARDAEMELRRLFADDVQESPKKPRKKITTEQKELSPSAEKKHRQRGDLTAALLRALPKMPTEFTSNQLIQVAGVPEAQKNSAFAAISRLASQKKGLEKSTTAGKFRRV